MRLAGVELLVTAVSVKLPAPSPALSRTTIRYWPVWVMSAKISSPPPLACARVTKEPSGANTSISVSKAAPVLLPNASSRSSPAVPLIVKVAISPRTDGLRDRLAGDNLDAIGWRGVAGHGGEREAPRPVAGALTDDDQVLAGLGDVGEDLVPAAIGLCTRDEGTVRGEHVDLGVEGRSGVVAQREQQVFARRPVDREGGDLAQRDGACDGLTGNDRDAVEGRGPAGHDREGVVARPVGRRSRT